MKTLCKKVERARASLPPSSVLHKGRANKPCFATADLCYFWSQSQTLCCSTCSRWPLRSPGEISHHWWLLIVLVVLFSELLFPALVLELGVVLPVLPEVAPRMHVAVHLLQFLPGFTWRIAAAFGIALAR